ncbi:hypothetical protein A4J85_000680 [Salmonella enterica subsp. enterica]|nr:hypothetical protein [Salmonella enterica subsp. enterica serovar Veneziana]EBP1816787.1 hypothetical protein [Salmonella enterica]EBU7788335.1 hypothetical protein [Salmonella enterica subsp. enterica serovar Duesseldorf]EDT5421965.1 hypothetical protein [Salmonella enterica subsp. enterica]EBX5338711.1 hypothetical protein [Salmonella enterica subsp. enterica serovar Duesseldorf]
MTEYSTFNSTNKSTLPERDSAPAQSGMRAADGFFKAKFRCPEPNILASDVSQIAYRTVRDYNRIARGSDKIW